jgi:hypothetical protein
VLTNSKLCSEIRGSTAFSILLSVVDLNLGSHDRTEVRNLVIHRSSPGSDYLNAEFLLTGARRAS